MKSNKNWLHKKKYFYKQELKLQCTIIRFFNILLENKCLRATTGEVGHSSHPHYNVWPPESLRVPSVFRRRRRPFVPRRSGDVSRAVTGPSDAVCTRGVFDVCESPSYGFVSTHNRSRGSRCYVQIVSSRV